MEVAPSLGRGVCTGVVAAAAPCFHHPDPIPLPLRRCVLCWMGCAIPLAARVQHGFDVRPDLCAGEFQDAAHVLWDRKFCVVRNNMMCCFRASGHQDAT